MTTYGYWPREKLLLFRSYYLLTRELWPQYYLTLHNYAVNFEPTKINISSVRRSFSLIIISITISNRNMKLPYLCWHFLFIQRAYLISNNSLLLLLLSVKICIRVSHSFSFSWKTYSFSNPVFISYWNHFYQPCIVKMCDLRCTSGLMVWWHKWKALNLNNSFTFVFFILLCFRFLYFRSVKFLSWSQ